MAVVESAPSVEPIDGSFLGKDIVSIDQFQPPDVKEVLDTAHAMRQSVEENGHNHLLDRSEIMTAVFYEPSSRTYASFDAAMKRLGGGVIPIVGVQYSSVSKGETLEDTMKTFAQYSDVLVLRHPQIGSAQRAAEVVDIPVINAGDGAGEHPTQALLDLFTIQEEKKTTDRLNVTMMGDLKYGRTVHSLARLLAHYGATVNYVSPDQLRMPEELQVELAARGLVQNEHDRIDEVLGDTDVLYVTRVQKERLELSRLGVRRRRQMRSMNLGRYIVTPELMKRAPNDLTLMHPLPRVDEISSAVDDDPRAAYWRQVQNGMYVRMALLSLVLGKMVEK